jgi:peptidoglycan hydrolase-like protein with peptidoglycan-binding domain
MTRAAVRAFQQKVGITVDGLAGPQTFGALESELASLTG